MRIEVNGTFREVDAAVLGEVLRELGYGAVPFATAVNGAFVPAPARGATVLHDGDRVEVLVPMQGG